MYIKIYKHVVLIAYQNISNLFVSFYEGIKGGGGLGVGGVVRALGLHYMDILKGVVILVWGG